MSILGPTVCMANSGLSFDEARVKLTEMVEKASVNWAERQKFEEELKSVVKEFKNRKIGR